MKLAEQYADSTQSLSKALYDIVSATIPAGQALGVLEIAAKSAVAGMTTTATSARAITLMLNAFGLSARRSGDVADWMFEVVRRGVIEFPELAAQLGQAASAAALAGINLEEFGAAISTVTRAGIPAGRAMTSINGMMLTFFAPTAKAVKVAKKYNLELSVGTIRRIGLIGIMKKLTSASAEEQRAIFRSVRGFRAASALMMNLGGFEEDYRLQKKRSGRTLEAFNKVAATAAFQLGRMKEAVFNVARQFGVFMLPKIKAVTKYLREFFNALTRINPATKKLLVNIILIAPAMVATMVVLPRLTKLLGGLHKLLLFPITSPLTTLLMVIAGIAASKVWNEFGGNISRMFDAVQSRINAFIEWFKANYWLQTQRILVNVEMAWEGLVKVIENLMGQAANAISGATGKINANSTALMRFADGIVRIVEAITDSLSYVATHAPTIFKLIATVVERQFTKMWFYVSNFISNFSTVFDGLWDMVAPAITSFGSALGRSMLAIGKYGAKMLAAGLANKTGVTEASMAYAEILHGNKMWEIEVSRKEEQDRLNAAKAEGKISKDTWLSRSKEMQKYYNDLVAEAEAALERVKEKVPGNKENVNKVLGEMMKGMKLPAIAFGSPTKFNDALKMTAEQLKEIADLMQKEIDLNLELGTAEAKRQAERAKRIKERVEALAREKALQAQMAALARLMNSKLVKGAGNLLGGIWDTIADSWRGKTRKLPRSQPLGIDSGLGTSLSEGERAPIWLRRASMGAVGGDPVVNAANEHKDAAHKDANKIMELLDAHVQTAKKMLDMLDNMLPSWAK